MARLFGYLIFAISLCMKSWKLLKSIRKIKDDLYYKTTFNHIYK